MLTTCSRFGFGRHKATLFVPDESFDHLDMTVVIPDPDGGVAKFERTAYRPTPKLVLPINPALLASFGNNEVVKPRQPQV